MISILKSANALNVPTKHTDLNIDI